MPTATVEQLRRQLREKFPAAHQAPRGAGSPPGGGGTAGEARGDLPHEAASRHLLDPRDFPPGAITELSPGSPACGLSLLVTALLSAGSSSPALANTTPPPHRNTAPLKHRPTETPALALIDARDRFDPASFTTGECSRLLWVRCRDARQAFQAGDLLLRDGNLPLVLLDLSSLPLREVRRIPSSHWHRLRQLAETTACSLVALTPSPIVPRTALRLELARPLGLADLERTRPELLGSLETRATRRRTRSA